jgi:aminoglycoside phosphotransferase (APT) family kinase protein
VDWDLAYPGPPLDDVAYALAYSTPFRDDDHALRWQAQPGPPDRRRRIRVFAEAYGISTDGLVDAVIARQRKTADHSRILKARGLVAPWTTTASVAQNDELADWSDTHRSLF